MWRKNRAAKKFREELLAKSDKDYGICPPPIEAQEGLNVLIKHFLGEDWYVMMSISQEQVNAEAIYQILKEYRGGKQMKLWKLQLITFLIAVAVWVLQIGFVVGIAYLILHFIFHVL